MLIEALPLTGGAYEDCTPRPLSLYRREMGGERKRGVLWSMGARVGNLKQGQIVQLFHLDFFNSIIFEALIISLRPDTPTYARHNVCTMP